MADLKQRGITKRVPVVAVRETVIFPHTDPVLTFGRDKSVSAVNASFGTDKLVAIFTQKDAKVVDPDKDDLYEVGTLVRITQMMTTDGEVHSVVHGLSRITLDEVTQKEPFLTAKVTKIAEDKSNSKETKDKADKLSEIFKRSINLGKQAEIMTVMKLFSGQVDPNELVDQVASLLDLKTSAKQEILETLELEKRMDLVFDYMSHEVNVLELERSISVKTQKRFESQMRKAMLREKKRTIEEELGEEEPDSGSDEIQAYKKKIKASKMPKEVRRKANKELKKLEKLSIHNPETGYIRNYLDWLCDLPWGVQTKNNASIIKAEEVLEKEHYGITKAKERILEYLAVMKVKADEKKKSSKGKKGDSLDDSHPTILCFIGPPGVGKTSIGKSIAHALDRKFARMSLGGVRDEAEIRGHRRTYVGAMPGRIIQGIKNAESVNPVFMLDEVDKLGTDFRGDPSSALLEALDPEQNAEFSDHYLEVPFDLSKVMFICTGNVLEDIPGPLRDRMEVITFPGYTVEDKYNIAKKFLTPKQMKAHGLASKKIKIDDEAYYEIIERYTREAGVRNLERNVATVCRKIARLVAEKKKYPKVIKKSHVKKYLGPQKFNSLIAEKKDEVGVVTGLAVTPAGGEILFVEVALMPGKGRLTLTGKLGDVMKESAKASFTWVKSHWYDLGLRKDFAKNIDVHIHVPEGAVPKDGPSAGVSLSTALVSALTGVPVRRDVAMTGEITLRGRVTEIGGVKGKVIAAHRAGIKTVILPKGNKKDMADVPKSVKDDIEFVFAERIDDVLKVSMKKWPVAVSKRKELAKNEESYIMAN